MRVSPSRNSGKNFVGSWIIWKTLGIVVALAFPMVLTGCKSAEEKAATGAGGNSTAPTASAGSTSSGNEIVIGEYGSFTGSEADFGIQTHQGIKLAVDEVNNAGGIDVGGKKVKVRLEKEDDQSISTKADTAVKRLIDEKNATAILGEVASASSLQGGKVCQEKGVPMISPSSTNVKVTQDRDYVFRICFLDSYQAAVVARFIRDGLKKTNVATFTNKSQSYSVGFTDEFKKAFIKYGGKIIKEAAYSPNDQDFRGQLTTLKALHPDAILIPGYYSDVTTIVKQARELGIDVPILGGDGWSSPVLLQNGGSAVNNCYFSDHMSIKDPRPIVQNFVKGYTTAANAAPTSMSALGYDAAKIMFDAISRAKSTDKKAIRDAIAQTKDYDGVTGKITIDENRNAKKSAVIIAVKNNAFEYETTIPDPDLPMAK